MVEYQKNNNQLSTKATIAVLPVAGRGTRMLPASKAIAKELMPVGNLPLIAHAIIEARAAGIEEFIIITSPRKPDFQKALKPDHEYMQLLRKENRADIADLLEKFAIDDSKLTWIIQDEAQGFGHAVSLARDAVANRPFIVMSPDDFIVSDSSNVGSWLKQMIAMQERLGGCVVMVEKVNRASISKYGVIKPAQPIKAGGKDRQQAQDYLLEEAILLDDIIEKPSQEDAPSNYGVIARYVLDASIFDALEHTTQDKNGEIQLTDALRNFIPMQKLHAFMLLNKRYDCGIIEGWIRANMAIASKNDPSIIDSLANELQAIKKKLNNHLK